MKPHLIALDLDGTTLYDWHTLTPHTERVLKHLQGIGHKVVIATGRPHRSSVHFYHALELDTPMINFNGALTLHPKDTTFQSVEHLIPLEAVHKIIKDNADLIDNAFCEYHNDIFVSKVDDVIFPYLQSNGGNIITGNLLQTLTHNPNGFIILTKPEQAETLMSVINEQFNGQLKCISWGGKQSNIVEVSSPKTCKGIAITHVADHFNIPNEHIIAFGDEWNDVGMIKQAAHGVAMGNAIDDLKSISDAIAGHHKEDGVANYLIQFFNLSLDEE